MALEINGTTHFIPNKDEVGVLTTQLSIAQLLDVYHINSDVNRDITPNRVQKLSNYLSSYDTALGVYIPAIILAYEGEEPFYKKENDTIYFGEEVKFVVLDGQHRIKAFENYKKYLSDYDSIMSFLDSKVTVQIYFGLSEEEQRKLFSDINYLSDPVSHNISFKFDGRDVINVLIKELLSNQRNNALIQLGVEQEKNSIRRPSNQNWISIARLNRFISYLLLGTAKSSGKTNDLLAKNYDYVIEFLRQYFILLRDALPKNPGDVFSNLSGHEALQNAIAIVSHEEIIKLSNETIDWKDDWKLIVEHFQYIDWSVDSGIFDKFLTFSGNYPAFIDNKHMDIVPILKEELWSHIEQTLE